MGFSKSIRPCRGRSLASKARVLEQFSPLPLSFKHSTPLTSPDQLTVLDNHQGGGYAMAEKLRRDKPRIAADLNYACTCPNLPTTQDTVKQPFYHYGLRIVGVAGRGGGILMWLSGGDFPARASAIARGLLRKLYTSFAIKIGGRFYYCENSPAQTLLPFPAVPSVTQTITKCNYLRIFLRNCGWILPSKSS